MKASAATRTTATRRTARVWAEHAVGMLVNITNSSPKSRLQLHRRLDAERVINSELVSQVLRLEKELEQARLELKLERQNKFASPKKEPKIRKSQKTTREILSLKKQTILASAMCLLSIPAGSHRLQRITIGCLKFLLPNLPNVVLIANATSPLAIRNSPSITYNTNDLQYERSARNEGSLRNLQFKI